MRREKQKLKNRYRKNNNQKKDLFSNSEEEKVGQPNEALEYIEVEEVPGEKGYLIYPATKKGENTLRRSAGFEYPPLTSK